MTDTAQRRAERILAMHQMNEVRAGYRVQVHDALVEALQQARREALEEAAKLCRDNASISASPHTAWVCNLIADTLDRLREGVK